MTGKKQQDFNLSELIRWEFTAFVHTLSVFVLSALIYTSYTVSPDFLVCVVCVCVCVCVCV
jgi:hypothetical protein